MEAFLVLFSKLIEPQLENRKRWLHKIFISKNYRENIFLMSLFAFFESFSILTSNGSLLNAHVAKVLIIFDLMPCWLGCGTFPCDRERVVGPLWFCGAIFSRVFQAWVRISFSVISAIDKMFSFLRMEEIDMWDEQRGRFATLLIPAFADVCNNSAWPCVNSGK